MTDSEKKTIISLFAHPDDELGAVGTLANHTERGDRVILSWTTNGELTTLFNDDLTIEEVKEERRRHGREIANIIGADDVIFLDIGDSMVENTRENRIKVAKVYINEKPDAVITWGLQNSHPDHRNTGYLALDAIKMARINHVMGTENPHRENVKLLSYYEDGNGFDTKYIGLTEDSMTKAKECAEFYADIYDWKNVEAWAVDRRRAYGLESNTKYAEKFNVRFEFDGPPQFVV